MHLHFLWSLPQQLPLLSTPARYFAPIKIHLADEETAQAITGMSTTSSTDNCWIGIILQLDVYLQLKTKPVF